MYPRELRELAIKYQQQLAWVRHCGGNREGYRKTYTRPGNADSIYEADIERVDKLYSILLFYGVAITLNDHDYWYMRAVEELGEDYFA